MTKKEKVLLTTSIFLGLILIIGASFAWLRLTVYGSKVHVLRVAGLEITLDDKLSEGISFDKAYPLTD